MLIDPVEASESIRSEDPISLPAAPLDAAVVSPHATMLVPGAFPQLRQLSTRPTMPLIHPVERQTEAKSSRKRQQSGPDWFSTLEQNFAPAGTVLPTDTSSGFSPETNYHEMMEPRPIRQGTVENSSWHQNSPENADLSEQIMEDDSLLRYSCTSV
jgi:hypothetical protein